MDARALRRVLLFAIAGLAGFATDVAVLHFLITVSPMGPFSARIVSIACALAVNFSINRALTFGASDRPFVSELSRYLTVAGAGSVLNYGIYAIMLIAIDGMAPVLATAIALAVVSAFSFAGYSRFVFSR